MKETNDNKRNHGIDVLRGFAILSVLLLHINIRIPFSETLMGSIIPGALYKIIFWSGYYGVCVFFVISGFLITNTSINRWKVLPKLSIRSFYAMRFARIIPLLIVLLVVLSMLHYTEISGFVIQPKKTSLGRALLAALTFHINWLEIKVGYLPASWDILWSLSIEEFFYFFFPIIFFIVRKEWHFVALVSIFLIISPFARTTLYPGNELGDRNYFAYLDAISLGCIAAIVSRRIKIKKNHLTIIGVIGWILFLLVMFFRKWVSILGLSAIGLNVTLLAIGTAIILIWMQKRLNEGQQTMSKYTGIIRFLGRNSYEIYLTHMFVVFLFVNAFNILKISGEWIIVLYIIVIAFSGILGGIVARFLSNPANKFLRRKLDMLNGKTIKQ